MNLVMQIMWFQACFLYAKTEEEIRSYADSREDLKLVGDYFRMRAEKYEVLGTLPQSQRTFVMSGYVAAKAVPAIEKPWGTL